MNFQEIHSYFLHHHPGAELLIPLGTFKMKGSIAIGGLIKSNGTLTCLPHFLDPDLFYFSFICFHFIKNKTSLNPYAQSRIHLLKALKVYTIKVCIFSPRFNMSIILQGNFFPLINNIQCACYSGNKTYPNTSLAKYSSSILNLATDFGLST